MPEKAAETWMERDSRDVWPDDERQAGKYDIELTTVQNYPGVTARIVFVCPHQRVCNLLLAPEPIGRSAPDRLFVWGWNGNVERPSLTPSVNCIAEKDGKATGGCGWHGFITDGVMR